MYQPVDSQLGEATLETGGPAIAGKHGSWTITYTVGPYGMDSGGQLKIAIRDVSDWGVPQFDSPELEGFSTATTNGSAKVRAAWVPKGYIRPRTGAVVLNVYDGSLAPGDLITVVLGETGFGSPGLRAQTYVESAFEFFIAVDPTNACDPRPLATQLTVPVVADNPLGIDAILPSQILLNRPTEIFVKGEDLWRNPTPAPEALTYAWIGTGAVDFEGDHLIARTAGEGYLIVKSDQFECRSNPVVLAEVAGGLSRYWGDLHAQTAGTVGVGSEDEYFTFGRDVAKLDFSSHQGNDFQIDDAYWAHLNQKTAEYHEDGRFVLFPGYEWSASSPTGGDHNIFYRKEGHPILRSSHWLVPHVPASELSPAHPADQFYEKLKRAVPSDEVIVCQHVGGRYANLQAYFDQDLIRLVELVSVWGVFEWMLWDAIDRGYVVGVMGNSDGHHGRPGAEGSGMTVFGIENGLTCVLSDQLTRDGIFDALNARRCYATTGKRMLLDFTVNGLPMGSLIQDRPKMLVIEAEVTGTGPLESLQLYQGRELIAEVQPESFHHRADSTRFRVSWRGSRERGRQRRVTWDGSVQLVGNEVVSADTFQFDVVADGITGQSAKVIDFQSKTTGDRDGLDLILKYPHDGTLIFDSAAGTVQVELAELTAEAPKRIFDFGGIDMEVTIERYPHVVTQQQLKFQTELDVPHGGTTALFVKATQVDGHMAWASPVWLEIN